MCVNGGGVQKGSMEFASSRSGSRSLKCQLQLPRVRFNLASCIDLTMAHCQLTIAIVARALSRLKWSNRITLCTVTIGA